MRKFIKPAAIVFYLFSALTFFFAGISFASFSGAAEGQELASGAILLSYGMVFSLITILIAIVIVAKVSSRAIISFNKMLLVIIILFVVIFA